MKKIYIKLRWHPEMYVKEKKGKIDILSERIQQK